MEFRLLGPMELLRDGVLLTFTPHKPRALLAMLLVGAGRVVPWNRLQDELWHPTPPRSAMANLRTYAAQVRHQVFGAEPGRVLADPGGYRLLLHGDLLDLSEFERHCAEGRRARADGDPAAALGAYEQASALWRGRPFAGIHAGPRLGALAVALEERYATHVEDSLELRLGLVSRRDEYAELVAALRGFLTEQPLRESAWRLLMLSLYRLGDPGGALAAYAQARLTFRNGLGLDPGAALQELQQAVLRRDPLLDRQPGPAQVAHRPAVAWPRPRTAPLQVAVCGSSDCSSSERKAAAEVGRLLAARGAVVICDADRVGAEAAAAARAEGGQAIATFNASGPHADAVIAVGASWDALSKVATARRHDDVPVVLLGGWSIVDRLGVPVVGVRSAELPEEAVRYIFGD